MARPAAISGRTSAGLSCYAVSASGKRHLRACLAVPNLNRRVRDVLRLFGYDEKISPAKRFEADREYSGQGAAIRLLRFSRLVFVVLQGGRSTEVLTNFFETPVARGFALSPVVSRCQGPRPAF